MGLDEKFIDGSALTQKICVIVGTRPGIVMFAPIIHSLKKNNAEYFVIHTGQHYSPNMDADFFSDLKLPDPEYKIQGVQHKKTHAGQTALMMEEVEKILIEEKPALVLVGGDANTNLAAALAARKLRISVAHIEAGERSFDWSMPEEHNRRIIDHISDLLFATAEKAKTNLQTENVQGKIVVTGNPIVDASILHFDIAKDSSNILETIGLEANKYAILTSHREENVDSKEKLAGIIKGVGQCADNADLIVVFAMHPRTKKRIEQFGLQSLLEQQTNIITCDALGYLDFLKLLGHSKLVFTDSGGVQQEAYIHKIPTVTLRENTEWIETLESGCNRLAGTDPGDIVAAFTDAIDNKSIWGEPFGDKKSAQRIAQQSVSYVQSR